jgi:hypothetical protein
VNHLNNIELTWEAEIEEVTRSMEIELEKSAGEAVNEKVQHFLEQIREKNKKIVRLVQRREKIESLIREEVGEEELKELQKENAGLI